MQQTIPFGLKFIGLNCSFDIYANDIELDNGRVIFPNIEISKYFFDFYNIFAENQIIGEDNTSFLQLNFFLKYTNEMKEKLQNFVDLYSDKYPHVKGFIKCFNKFEDNEIFFILPAHIIIDTKCLINIIKELGKHNNKEIADLSEFYDVLFTDYNTHIYGEVKHYIGKSKKEDRVCRWCHRTINSNPPATFKQKAHAISESLGNKTLILNEECDECNAKFSETIERSFTNMVMPLNTFFGIVGKNGVPKIKSGNTEMENLGNSQISIISDNVQLVDGKPSMVSIPCGTIISQDIYKTLCKFALSVLEDENTLAKFKWTTDWIHSDNYFENVPVVKTLFTYQFFPENPTVQLYIRKNKKTELPLMFASFYYNTYVYSFIVPANKEEFDKYCNIDVFNDFWEKTPFAKVQGWKDEIYSNSKKMPIIYNIKFEQKKHEK